MRKMILAGNWKMNTLKKEASGLASKIADGMRGDEDIEVIVFPPFVFIERVLDSVHAASVAVGGQDVFYESHGAYTGEISVPMLKDLGCTYVLVGHSERRRILGETDDVINRKIKRSFLGGLVPLFCIGETHDERKAGETEKVLNRQIVYGLEGIGGKEIESVVIAYEPVWAIGTGLSASVRQAEEVHRYIRDVVARFGGRRAAESMRILYGGSVTPANAAGLLSQENIDGVLVGGASLSADAFLGIIQAAFEVRVVKKAVS
ncbi:MAG: triose-phosphate isomerase [Spirochaetes bacterium]|nr:triose-phosphate isomerase [Spirochaetota bacterium]